MNQIHYSLPYYPALTFSSVIKNYIYAYVKVLNKSGLPLPNASTVTPAYQGLYKIFNLNVQK